MRGLAALASRVNGPLPLLPTSWYLRHLLAHKPNIVAGNKIIVLRAEERNQ